MFYLDPLFPIQTLGAIIFILQNQVIILFFENLLPILIFEHYFYLGNYFGKYFIMGGRLYETIQPECFLFGDNEDLNFLASKPAPV